MHLLYACLSLLAGPTTSPTDSLRADSLTIPLRPSPYAYKLAANNRLPGLVSHPLLAFKGLLPGLLVRPGSADPNQMPILHWRGIASVFQNESQPALWVDGLPTLGVEDHAADDWDTLSLYHNALVPGALGAGAGLGVLGIQTKRARWGADGRAVKSFQVNATGGLARPVLPKLLSADEFRELEERNRKVFNTVPDSGTATTDWQKVVSRQPVISQFRLNTTGGNRHLGYYASIDYLNNPGVALRSDYQRLSTRLNTDLRLLDGRLTGSLDGLFTTTRRQSIDDFTYYFTTVARPVDPVFLPDGRYFENRAAFLQRNPVAVLNEMDSTRLVKTFSGRTRLRYELAPGLSIEAHLGIGVQNDRANLNDRYVLFNSNTDNLIRQRQTKQSLVSAWLSSQYSRTIGISSIRLNLGYGFAERTNQQEGTTTVTRSGVTSSNRDSLKTAWKVVSFYGTVSYQAWGRFNLSGQLRYDGSSLFGANQKSRLYGSAMLEVNLLKKPGKWLDQVIVHGNIGNTWNADAFRPGNSLATLIKSGAYFEQGQWRPSYRPDQKANPDLRPERQYTTNLGLTFLAGKGRLMGRINAYTRRSEGLIWRVSLSNDEAQYGNQVVNTFTIQNKGIDGFLQWQVIRRKLFDWDFSLTTNYNRNKVTHIEPVAGEFFRYTLERTYPGIRIVDIMDTEIQPNQPVSTLYGLVAIGTERQTPNFRGYKWADLNKNGQFDNEDKTGLGSYQPLWQSGINQQFRVRKWQLNVFLTRQKGQRVVSLNRQFRNFRYDVPYQNALREVIEDTDLLPIGNFHQVISPFVENASFTRLENLTLSYSLPLPHNQHLYLSLTAWNLKVWTKYRGIDPELNYRGFESLTYYPYSRSVQLGASWRF